MFPTSDADFILFESEVRKWVEIFALYEYELHVLHEHLTEKGWAECKVNSEAMNCKIWLNKFGDSRFSVHT